MRLQYLHWDQFQMKTEHQKIKLYLKDVPSTIYFIPPSSETRESWFLTDDQGKILWALAPFASCGGGSGSGFNGSSGQRPIIYQNNKPVSISTKAACGLIKTIQKQFQ